MFAKQLTNFFKGSRTIALARELLMRLKISNDDERSIIRGRDGFETDSESVETLDEEEVDVDTECLPVLPKNSSANVRAARPNRNKQRLSVRKFKSSSSSAAVPR